MVAALVALLLTQEPDLFGDPSAPAEDVPPLPPSRPEPPAPIPPPDGPVPDGVPKGEDPPPLKPHVPRPPDEVRRDLLAERLHLIEGRPSIAVPTVLSTLSGVAMIFGAVLSIVGLPPLLRGDVRATFYIGAPLTFVGLAGFGFGLVWLRERLLEQEPYDDRIEEIEKELGW